MKTDKEWRDEWNQLHIKYSAEEMKDAKITYEEGFVCYESIRPGYRNKMMIKYIEKLILKARKAYYESGDEFMSDDWYDWLEMALRILDPENELLEKVGS